MRWRGEDVPWPVVQIPVSHALLNPYSHRIKAQIGSLGLSGQVIADDPFGDEAQEFIAEIVCGTPRGTPGSRPLWHVTSSRIPA